MSSAFPNRGVGRLTRVYPRTRFSAERFFRGCRHFFMFRPPSLLTSQIVPTAARTAAGQLRLLRPSRTCFVTSACIGYACRPNTGNWRHRDFHPARFAALSAAPPYPTLRVQPHDCPRMARGQDGSLRLSCMTLTFTTPRRFIPTLSAPEWVLTTQGANQLAYFLGHARSPRPAASDLPGPEQTKALPVPADDGRGFEDKNAGLSIVPDCAQPSPQEPIRRGQFRSLDGALQNPELMAKCEDLELKCRTAPKGSEKRGQKSGQNVPEGESKGKGQLPAYQSNRSLREPQLAAMSASLVMRDRPIDSKPCSRPRHASI